jgi:hypothetical protein
MTNGAGGDGFAFKARRKLGVVAGLGEQGFHSNPTFEGHVQRLVDHAHGASADLPNDLILSPEDLPR